MPGEKIEKNSIQVLEVFKMAPEAPRSSEQSSYRDDYERTLRDVTWKEWIAVAILCFVNLINYMDRFTVAAVLKDVQSYFDIGDDKGGILQTAFVLSYMLFGPIFGYLGDRYNRCLIMAFGVSLWSLTTLFGSFMTQFGWFITFRALVGIGEASYSTIAPTIISDLFSKSLRSQMLAIFYFAIPVGSGLGYIVGSETAKLMGSWQWGLRVTPALGLLAVILMCFVLKEPQRGLSEGSTSLEVTSYREDIKDLLKNGSFMFSTAGFTCVSFVAGALAWWGYKFMYMGILLQSDNPNEASADNVAFIFGIVSMLSGILGVPAGSYMAQRLRETYPRVDPHICAFGMIVSTPFVFFACVTANKNTVACYCFVFLAEFFLNLTWSIVADMLLYVVIPTRRSTAEGFQLLISHALGDAGSPYLIGVVSEALKVVLAPHDSNSTVAVHEGSDLEVEFRSLQYALFITCFIEVLGGLFFLVTAFFIVKDKAKVDKVIRDGIVNIDAFAERTTLVS